MKTFEQILQEAGRPEWMRARSRPDPDSVKNDGIKLPGGIKAYCRKNKECSSSEPTFDLIFEAPGGAKKVIYNWAFYRGGYDQGWGVSNKQQWYLETESHYGAGNGSGVNSKTKTPSLRYYRHMESHLLDHYKKELKELLGY